MTQTRAWTRSETSYKSAPDMAGMTRNDATRMRLGHHSDVTWHDRKCLGYVRPELTRHTALRTPHLAMPESMTRTRHDSDKLG